MRQTSCIETCNLKITHIHEMSTDYSKRIHLIANVSDSWLGAHFPRLHLSPAIALLLYIRQVICDFYLTYCAIWIIEHGSVWFGLIAVRCVATKIPLNSWAVCNTLCGRTFPSFVHAESICVLGGPLVAGGWLASRNEANGEDWKVLLDNSSSMSCFHLPTLLFDIYRFCINRQAYEQMISTSQLQSHRP